MGRAFVYGDNVDTDAIIPARYLTTSDPSELAAHAFEDYDPDFVGSVRTGDVVVAGANFGCGSSREHAATAIVASGVYAVVANSFARIFFRNAINTGLPVLVCAEAAAAARMGDQIEVEPRAGIVRNLTQGTAHVAEPVPEFVSDIVLAGGLVPWVRKKLARA